MRRFKIIFPICLFALASSMPGVRAQGLFHISSGASVKISGNATIKLNNANLNADGSFTPGNSTVEFQGNAGGGLISGAQPLTFNHLAVNRPGQKVQLAQNIQVNGNLTFTAGLFDLNGKNLTLGQPNGTLVNESETSRITGAAGGEVVLTATLNAPNQQNPGNIGVAISSSANLGSTIIRRGQVPATIPGSGASIQRTFDIQPVNNNSLDATLRFRYFDAELSTQMENSLALYRKNGANWETSNALGAGMETRDTTQNFVERSALAHLSQWTLAAQCQPASTAISDTICPGGSLVFNGSTLTVAGMYTANLLTSIGCDSTVTLTLAVSTPATSITGAAPLCPGDKLTLRTSGTFVQYNWTGGKTADSLLVSTAGTYTITVTDNSGCTATASVQIAQPPVLNASIAAPGQITCAAPQITLDASASDKNSVNISWTTQGGNIVSGGNTLMPVVSQAGAYILHLDPQTPGARCPNTDTVVVAANTAPPTDAALTLKNVTCFGLQNGQLTVGAVSGGTGPFQYALDGVTYQSANTFSGLTPGGYTLSVRGANGCVFQKMFSITEPGALVVNLGPDTSFCPGTAPIVLDAGSGFAYQWSNNKQTQQINISQPGTYSVIITNASGCTATDSVVVTQRPLLSATIANPPQITCAASQITLDASGSDNNFTIISWTTPNGNILSGGNTLMPVVTQAGTYVLHVDPQGVGVRCPNTDTVTVTANTAPPTDAALNIQNVPCFGQNNGQLTVGAVSGGVGPFEYALNSGTYQGSPTFTNLSPGTYTLSVRGANRCTFQKVFDITQPAMLTLELGPDKSLCASAGPLILDAGGGFNYLWSSGQQTQQINVTQSGSYAVTITHPTGGCTATDAVTVTILPVVAANIQAPPMISCTNPQFNLDASASSTGASIQYQWQAVQGGNIVSGATTTAPLVDRAGAYILQVTDSNTGCTASSTVQVQGNTQPPGQITLDVKQIGCGSQSGGSITVSVANGGFPPFQYSLDGAPWQDSPTFTNLMPGTYDLSVRGANACETSAGATIVPAYVVELSLEEDLTGRTDSSAVLVASATNGQPPLSWQWSGNGLKCLDCPKVEVVSQLSAYVYCTVTDAQGCSATAQLYLLGTFTPPGEAVPPNDVLTGDGQNGDTSPLVFPDLKKDPDLYKNNDIVIFNRWGQIVYKVNNYQNDWVGRDLQGNALPEGTYYYVLLLRDGVKDAIHGSVTILR